MRFTSPSRRALGLLAASTIGMSTAVLGVSGAASAAPLPTTLLAGQTVTSADVSAFVVGDGVCEIDWQVYGAGGGAGSDSSGAPGGVVVTTTDVTAGDLYSLYPGENGGVAGVSGGTGGGGYSDDDGDFSGEDGDEYDGVISGGGGGGSVVVGPTGPTIGAFGGDGGDSDFVEYGYGGGFNFAPDVVDADRASDGAAASIIAEGVACEPEVSYAPYLNFVDAGDASATVNFVAPDNDDNGVTVTGYEVSTDDGVTWAPLAVTEDEGTLLGTVTGLTNEVSYEVRVRAVSGANKEVKGAESQAETVTPYKPIAAPTITSLTTGPSQVTLTWTAPAGAVSGYGVGYGQGFSGNGPMCATDQPTVLTCTFALPAGSGYSVSLRALDDQGRNGLAVLREAVTVPAPAVPSAVPTKDDGDIVGPVGPITAVKAGQTITVQGEGFALFSTVQLTVFSSPVSLGTVVTDDTGFFRVDVTLPANLTNGTHYLVATGINPDFTTRNLVITVTVSGGVVTGATLANTGVETAVPLAGGALAVLAGMGLLVGARRRSTV